MVTFSTLGCLLLLVFCQRKARKVGLVTFIFIHVLEIKVYIDIRVYIYIDLKYTTMVQSPWLLYSLTVYNGL